MPQINIDAECIICRKDMRSAIEDHGYGHVSAELSKLLLCEECQKRLKRILYPEQEVNNGN